jgi:hypothetical protein
MGDRGCLPHPLKNTHSYGKIFNVVVNEVSTEGSYDNDTVQELAKNLRTASGMPKEVAESITSMQNRAIVTLMRLTARD